MSTGPPIPEMRLFQILTLKIKVKGHGCGQRVRSHKRPGIQWSRLFFLFFFRIRPTVPEIQPLDSELGFTNDIWQPTYLLKYTPSF